MESTGKIKSAFTSDPGSFFSYLAGEAAGLKDYLLLGERKEGDPKGRYLLSTSYTKEHELATAFLNMMALNPFFARPAIFAVNKYLEITGMGEVTYKNETRHGAGN
ncbi:MAG: hypothetical protein DBY35_06570 [Bacteroidales bacterium]|nr:MAG: hypothetical protein DBY35_06570 [Bacteroidales bacterium]